MATARVVASTSSVATSISATTSAAESTTSTGKSPAAAKTKATSHATTKAATAATVHATGTSESVLAHLQYAALPVVAIELLDRVSRVVGVLEDDNAGALGASVRSDMDISSDHSTAAS